MPKQYAALPFRVLRSNVEVLLITTRRKRRWSVPKGSVQGVVDPRTIAKIEAFEEAGVEGIVAARAIGRFRHQKSKGKRKQRMSVAVFPMLVKRQRADWPEMHEREAIWLPAMHAAEKVHKKRLKSMIRRLVKSGPAMTVKSPGQSHGNAR